MEDSVDEVLEFLKRNGFTRAEAALRGELASREDFDDAGEKEAVKGVVGVGTSPRTQIARMSSGEIFDEFITKEIEAGDIVQRFESEKADAEIQEATKGKSDDSCKPYTFPVPQESKKPEITHSFVSQPIDVSGELPRLPLIRLRPQENSVNTPLDDNDNFGGCGTKISSLENSSMGVPLGQSGGPRTLGSRLSVSQGIAEDTDDLVSGFGSGNFGDDLADSPHEFWDSDEYSDDTDVGYTRQPIEYENWFLTHEIGYPSENEKGKAHGSVSDLYPKSPVALQISDTYEISDKNDLITQHDGQLMDVGGPSFICEEYDFQAMLLSGEFFNESERMADSIDVGQHDSVRSFGRAINSGADEAGSEIHASFVGESTEGDIEYFHDRDGGISAIRPLDTNADSSVKSKREKSEKANLASEKTICPPAVSYTADGFSLESERTGVLEDDSSKLLGSRKGMAVGDDTNESGDELGGKEMLTRRRKRTSSDSSLVRSSSGDMIFDADIANILTGPPASKSCDQSDDIMKEQDENANHAREDPGTLQEDEDAAVLQEIREHIKAHDEEWETFDLKIIHRKNRTGFMAEKDFPEVLNSLIAGRYLVKEYIGSGVFSKAIQAVDLHTGTDVCLKIIKNKVDKVSTKEFFDQSLDEIKLLKLINKQDPSDKYHIVRMYDYFYYREHLMIVCELLKGNLYEYHKFIRESGGEAYFTMPRLQSVTIQCLEALQFLHELGLIHCDLKPDNILLKSYSRCDVKVIDLGSSCFETDHLCSYVQSRAYRAPEVVLGLPYGKKIDIWSLGCILSELCSGIVLFKNDSPATLLARVIGIIGPIDPGMLAKGQYTNKYFTKKLHLYEKNQETGEEELLVPKKTSLRHRLKLGDKGFIDFVTRLLQINPEKRSSASEALAHPWLSQPY